MKPFMILIFGLFHFQIMIRVKAHINLSNYIFDLSYINLHHINKSSILFLFQICYTFRHEKWPYFSTIHSDENSTEKKNVRKTI